MYLAGGRYGEAVGCGQSSVSMGTTSAPLLGGVAYHTGGFPAVPAMSLGLVVFSLAIALLMVEPDSPPAHHQVPRRFREHTDLEGQDSRPSLRGPEAEDERSALFWKNTEETRTEGRPVYHILFRSPRVLAAMSGIFVYSFVIISFEGLIPLFVKEVFQWNALSAALTFFSWIAPSMLGPVAGRASNRVGPRWIAVGGFLFAVAPLILLRLVTRNTTSQHVLLCGLLTCVGKPSSGSPTSNSSPLLTKNFPRLSRSRACLGHAFLHLRSHPCSSGPEARKPGKIGGKRCPYTSLWPLRLRLFVWDIRGTYRVGVDEGLFELGRCNADHGLCLCGGLSSDREFLCQVHG